MSRWGGGGGGCSPKWIHESWGGGFMHSSINTSSTPQSEKVTSCFRCAATRVHAEASSTHSHECPGAIVPTQPCRREDARRMEPFHYTESSCSSSGSRLLCCLPSTENWKHGTNNMMCYSNFAQGLVIRPSAITSVADRTDVHVFPACVPSPSLSVRCKTSCIGDHTDD